MYNGHPPCREDGGSVRFISAHLVLSPCPLRLGGWMTKGCCSEKLLLCPVDGQAADITAGQCWSHGPWLKWIRAQDPGWASRSVPGSEEQDPGLQSRTRVHGEVPGLSRARSPRSNPAPGQSQVSGSRYSVQVVRKRIQVPMFHAHILSDPGNSSRQPLQAPGPPFPGSRGKSSPDKWSPKCFERFQLS